MTEQTRFSLPKRIDSANAAQAEAALTAALEGCGPDVVLDAENLVYISSAGLRILLHLRKNHPGLRLVNASPEVYEILDMTGFTEMMQVERAYRTVSVDGCEEIGHGANGSVYRLSQDVVVKVYRNPDALDEIRHEREVARLALILGIPTAISYDVVRVGTGYGSVFELLNARSFSGILSEDPEKLDWCVREFTDLLKKIHSTEVPAGKLPEMKQTVLGWAEFLRGRLPDEAAEKLIAMVRAVPEDNHMLHGDYHTKNLELQNGEVLIIDMDTLAVGNRIFELGSIYNSFLGFYELDPEGIRSFQGFDIEIARTFWREFLAAYLETACAHKLREVEDKARILGYARMIRRAVRRGEDRTEPGRRKTEHWTQELLELLSRTDRLTFSRRELELPASCDQLEEVQAFVSERLGESCSMKAQMQIELAVEEIFVNIASYAYAPGKGKARIRVELTDDGRQAEITFRDSGLPYDPLAKEDPDVTLLANERQIGGLGIFLTKQVMDEVRYEYSGGQNILTLVKKL